MVYPPPLSHSRWRRHRDKNNSNNCNLYFYWELHKCASAILVPLAKMTGDILILCTILPKYAFFVSKNISWLILDTVKCINLILLSGNDFPELYYIMLPCLIIQIGSHYTKYLGKTYGLHIITEGSTGWSDPPYKTKHTFSEFISTALGWYPRPPTFNKV